MDEESRGLMEIFMQSDAPDSVAQRTVEDAGTNYRQQYGSPMAGMPMQSPGTQPNTSFHSMNPTQMMPQDMSPNVMQSDAMMQSPQQQQRQRYPQQHMGYGNGNYHAYGAGYPHQRSLSQTQLSPATPYRGSFPQDGGFMGSGVDFSPTSPTNQGMAPLRSPVQAGVMTSGQAMYYTNTSPYCGSPVMSPMAQHGGFLGGIGLTGIPTAQSMPTPNLPQMTPEQPFVPGSFPPPSPTQKKVQSTVMAGFFQSPQQQAMSAPIRSHQVHAGNVPRQTATSPVSQTFQQDMEMYSMPMDAFQQIPPFTSAGAGSQLHQQQSCMYADRSASTALQQIFQAQQLKVPRGSLIERRASYPGPANHTLPKSPNKRSSSSPRSTPSPKVHSPLPGSMPSPPPRQRVSGKVPSPSQNPGQLNRDTSPPSQPTSSPRTPEQNVGLASSGNELLTPQADVDPVTGLGKMEQANNSPPLIQTPSPGADCPMKGNAKAGHRSSSPAEPRPANQPGVNQCSPPNVSSEAADSSKKENVHSPSAQGSTATKSADPESNAGDTSNSDGEKPYEHRCKAEGDETADITSVSSSKTDDAEGGNDQNSGQHLRVPTPDDADSVEEQTVSVAETGAPEEPAQAEHDDVPPKRSSDASLVEIGATSDVQAGEESLDEGWNVINDDQQMAGEVVSDSRCDEELTEELAGSKEEKDSAPDSQSVETLAKRSVSPKQEKDTASDSQSAENLVKQEREDAASEETEEEGTEGEQERRLSSVSESTQTAQQPKATRQKGWPTQPTATITAKIIAKGHSAHSNQEVVVAKTPGGQMYLIQGNMLVPVHNITVQEDKGGRGPKVIVVNPSRSAPPLTFTNLVTQGPASSEPGGTKESASVTENLDTAAAKEVAAASQWIHKAAVVSSRKRVLSEGSRTNTDQDHKKIHSSTKETVTQTEGIIDERTKGHHDDRSTSTDSDEAPISPTKKRIGRPRGSKDKQKRKSHGHKRKFLESPRVKQAPTKYSRTANAIKETNATGTVQQGSTKKSPQEVPTIRKSGHVAKRHKLGNSHSTVRHISVRPRAGVDGDTWVCSLCGKPGNENVLGTLYGPYTAKLSRERRDSISKECKSPTKLTSPLRQDSNSAEGSLEDEGSSRVELWVHKDCAVWSHGVFMLGRTVHGLEQAVESAALHRCSTCSELGATLACFKRGCKKIFHFACAQDSGSSFNEENYTILCSSHKET